MAIRTTGNVFSYEAVLELNIKTKSYIDLLSGESFVRSDIITLQDPNNAEHTALRDANNFKHLRILQKQSTLAKESEGKVSLAHCGMFAVPPV